MRLSVFDLTYALLKRQQADSYSTEDKKRMYRLVCERLRKGWTAEEVLAGEYAGGGNLIDIDTFYYHSALQLIPPPPQLVLDLETGECRSTAEPWYLELVCSFTLEDLADYYLKRFRLPPEARTPRLFGGLSWLVKHHGLEKVLFLIDACRAEVEAGRAEVPESPLVLGDFSRAADEARAQKVNEMAAQGVNQVVPRQREPLPVCGAGSTAAARLPAQSLDSHWA